MTTSSNNLSLSQLQALYDDVELAILFDWLKLERPVQLRSINIESESDDADQDAGAIRLMLNAEAGYYSDFAVSNAVARLVLSKIQERLPQWAVGNKEGGLDFARSYTPKRQAKVDLLPQFQFMINWADSGPGYSWPESYYVAYLPGFNIHVVTASQDSPEVHGYTDEAIGHFPATESVPNGVHKVIIDWWQWQADEWGQNCWQNLFYMGDVDMETAMSWATEVWDIDTGEPLSESA